MRVLLLGATGMVGQGVLRECLLAPDVEVVTTLGRTALGQRHAKHHEIVCPDLFNLSLIASEVKDFDACFFCLGVSSSGMSEPEYTRLTYDLTISAAQTLLPLSPHMTFIYVSGAGTDSTEQGRTMWARVKGRTENTLLRMPFKAVYLFRPGVIQPLHGIRSKTPAYQAFYSILKPLLPVMRWLFPHSILTTEAVGRSMLAAARQGAPKPVLEAIDIQALAVRD